MEITIRIDNKGESVGTLGWLLNRAHSIKIGPTKESGKQGAWLKDSSGKTITVLAIRGWDNETDIVRAIRDTNDPFWLTADVQFTDAAWAIICKLQDLAIEAMNSSEKEELAESLVVTVVGEK